MTLVQIISSVTEIQVFIFVVTTMRGVACIIMIRSVVLIELIYIQITRILMSVFLDLGSGIIVVFFIAIKPRVVVLYMCSNRLVVIIVGSLL